MNDFLSAEQALQEIVSICDTYYLDHGFQPTFLIVNGMSSGEDMREIDHDNHYKADADDCGDQASDQCAV